MYALSCWMMPTDRPEAVEDRAHPLRVALGQVVVDRDHVDAAAGHRVERRGQRRDEGLALAGLHLRDLALVEHDRAEQLDVEGAHPQLAPADLAGGREDLRQRVVEHVLEVAYVFLLARLAQLARGAPSSRLRAPRRTARTGRHPRATWSRSSIMRCADLVVGQRLELGLERVDLVDERLELADVALVGVDERESRLSIGNEEYRRAG